MGTGFLKKKKEMRKLQDHLSKMRTDIDSLEATGEAGAGLVTVLMTGDYRIKSVAIKKECVDPEDIDGLQDLVRVAFNDARNKIEEKTKAIEGANPSFPMI
jgi:nucleoid-associated protein EbfC